MPNPINVLYLGMDPEVVPLLNSGEKIKIKAVGRINELYRPQTFSPIDRLFTKSYKSLYMGNLKKARQYNRLFQKLKGLASTYYASHSSYLDYLLKHEILILKAKDPELEKRVQALDIKLFVVNGWEMLPSRTVNIPALGCINLHPSRLPQYRGALPILWALKNKDKSSALTYMVLDTTMDGGGVLKQCDFPIEKDDNPITIEAKVKNIIQTTLLSTIEAYVDGQITPQVQDPKQASKTAKYDPYRKIEFSQEFAQDILHKVTHYYYYSPNYCSYFDYKDLKVKVKRCNVAKAIHLPAGEMNLIFPHLYAGSLDTTLKFTLFRDISLKSSLLLLCTRLVLQAKKLKIAPAFRN